MRIHTVSPLESFNDPGREYRAAEPDVPLRCCLRKSRGDEPVWLFRYTPTAGKGPYEEIGPIFTHVDCPSSAAADRLPLALLNNERILRAYNPAGQIHGGAVVPPESWDRAIADAFADPEIDSLQVRSLSHGCFLFAITRT